MTLCVFWLLVLQAVVIEGLRSQPEWNGQRGLVQDCDVERGRYGLLIKGRGRRPLGVRLECCRLESVVEQEGCADAV